MKNLTVMRKQIDRVDTKIVGLLDQRMSLTRDVAMAKNSELNTSFTDEKREEAVLARLQSLTNNLVLQDAIADVYQTLFHTSKSIRHLAHETENPFSTIGIIGDGLIGRSIAKTMLYKGKGSVVVTLFGREWTPARVGECDLIIIASPINTVVDIARSLYTHSSLLKPGVVVIDVASVKMRISNEFATLNDANDVAAPVFVPTHPMGGRKERGAKYARSTLFAGRPWVVTPTGNSPDRVTERVSQFVRYCGSEPILMEAKKHDGLITYVSHFPGFLSKSLLEFVSNSAEESLQLAGSGFEMMTKIGRTTNTRMRSQIVQNNTRNIQRVLREFIKYIQKNG
ncbi:prephenate dehydrogenase/arogenate dehydrogenase family protein [Candidatus Woesebacteria bacterium]|nr:prephenate dehydrogenase/arogenate dehydrogenase family protein [Candidatus Woesebacteria bacterium]